MASKHSRHVRKVNRTKQHKSESQRKAEEAELQRKLAHKAPNTIVLAESKVKCFQCPTITKRFSLEPSYHEGILLMRPWCVGCVKSRAKQLQELRARNFQKSVNMPKASKKQEVMERDGYKCVYCGENDRSQLTVDHKIPRSIGGDNSLSNLCCCCRECNNVKDNLTEEQFRQIHLPKILRRRRHEKNEEARIAALVAKELKCQKKRNDELDLLFGKKRTGTEHLKK